MSPVINQDKDHKTQADRYGAVADGYDPAVRRGLLVIPDISGYTELVSSTDFMTGRAVTYELLSAIIDYNILGMEIAEIEGDAVLFYKFGTPPSTKEILQQYELMLAAFKRKLKRIEKRFRRKFPLSLKAVAHYGKMANFSIGKFEKLYGSVVIEAHRLLKNDVPSLTYVLVTDDLLDECTVSKERELSARGIRSSQLCEFYGNMREVCFTYFDYTQVKH